jgi:hypothetical protein
MRAAFKLRKDEPCCSDHLAGRSASRALDAVLELPEHQYRGSWPGSVAAFEPSKPIVRLSEGLDDQTRTRDFRSFAAKLVNPEPSGDFDEPAQRQLVDDTERRVDALAATAHARRSRLELRLGPNHAVVEKYLLTIGAAAHLPWRVRQALKYGHGDYCVT